jgi:hypothetical protein
LVFHDLINNDLNHDITSIFFRRRPINSAIINVDCIVASM